MRKSSVLGLALVIASVGGVAHAAGDAAAGKAKSSTCVACHGKGGVSPTPMYPNLAGQHAAYLVKSLKAYRDGQRQDPVMSAMAKPLSDADIENLAAYYASMSCK